ncbi:MAG TPA: DUF3352 domain-containing protein [Candidatus Limnocylindrales bacterium]|nr:DUF3352 domain-containing protein [Candidatus Limnocylindrales bacterium]
MTDDLDKTTIVPQETYEPIADAAPAVPVVPPPTTSAGGHYRWAIAAGVVALVVLATALAISLFTGRAANAVVLGYVPSDSIMYGEVRMDLPGDQRANLAGFLAKFPGFADQSTIETKLDEVLDRIVGGATNGDQGYSADIKPWFAGEVAFSIGALPDPSSLSDDPSAMPDARALVLVSIKDEAAAKAWLDSLIAESGATTSSETYGDASLTLISGEGDQQGAYALLGGKVAVVGDVASVKAAVDTKGAGSFGSNADVKAALDATSGDHVGFMYMAIRPLLEWSSQVSPSQMSGLEPGGALAGLVPDWVAVALRVEGDSLVMEALAPETEGMNVGEARTSPVADHVPASAIVLSVSHDYGKSLLEVLDRYRSEPTLKPALDTIDQALDFLGGPDAAIGWIGDVAITVTKTDTGAEGGLVITPTDQPAAARLFTSLRTVLSLGGSTAGVTVRDEPYAGSTITIIDLGDLQSLAAMGGVSPDMLGTQGLPAGHIELAYAITDQVVVIGSGPGFVRHVLDTTAATSIGSNDRYKAMVGRVGQGSGIGFVDIAAIRGLIESALANVGPADRADYEQNIKPFLEPFDALITSQAVKGDVVRSRTIVTVK